MIASPEKARRRKFSRVCGLNSSLMPIFFQWSAISDIASASSVSSLGMLDDDGGAAGRRAAGGSRASLRLVRPISSSSLLACLGIVGRPLGRVLRLEQRRALHDRVVRGLGQADIDDLVQLVAVDRRATARGGSGRRALSLRQHLVLGVEVGIERELRARARLPQPHVDARGLGALPQERVVAHVEVARLQVGLAQPRLGRHQVGRRDGEDHAVEIGQLLRPCRRCGSSRDCARTRSAAPAAASSASRD